MLFHIMKLVEYLESDSKEGDCMSQNQLTFNSAELRLLWSALRCRSRYIEQFTEMMELQEAYVKEMEEIKRLQEKIENYFNQG